MFAVLLALALIAGGLEGAAQAAGRREAAALAEGEERERLDVELSHSWIFVWSLLALGAWTMGAGWWQAILDGAVAGGVGGFFGSVPVVVGWWAPRARRLHQLAIAAAGLAALCPWLLTIFVR